MTQLDVHRAVWHAKPLLREIYDNEFFARIRSQMLEGRTVEVGAGPGFFKQYEPETITFDIIESSWLDVVADCERLPLRNGSVTNVVCTDVIHHIADPMAFLSEAQRVLSPGGRLVMVEPWDSPFSRVVYRHLHHEDYDLGWRPDAPVPGAKDPFDGNQAIPFVLFEREWDHVQRSVPGLRLARIERFCLFAYLLSCGFKRPSLLPLRMYPAVATFERATRRVWARWASLRALVVVERT